jgi:serine/threonine protein kinase
MWGLGVTLYEAVSRSLPFPPATSATATGAARYPQLVAAPVPLGKEAPVELGEAILACLERRPEDRPRALDLAHTIEPWVASLPAPRLGLFRPGGRTRRHESSLSRPSPASHGEPLVLGGMRGGTREGGGMP